MKRIECGQEWATLKFPLIYEHSIHSCCRIKKRDATIRNTPSFNTLINVVKLG